MVDSRTRHPKVSFAVEGICFQLSLCESMTPNLKRTFSVVPKLLFVLHYHFIHFYIII
jgi:hypothetical protein